MRNKFYTAKGYLTQYALACGYLDTNVDYNSNPESVNISLSYEGFVYHVKGYDHKNKQRICWDSFDTLPEARKAFQQVLKENKQQRKINHV